MICIYLKFPGWSAAIFKWARLHLSETTQHPLICIYTPFVCGWPDLETRLNLDFSANSALPVGVFAVFKWCWKPEVPTPAYLQISLWTHSCTATINIFIVKGLGTFGFARSIEPFLQVASPCKISHICNC